jgi:hypothetical protein
MRRRIAVVGLLAAAVTTLVVAPASTASAGRNSSAVKVHNLTKDATLVVSHVEVHNSYAPYWEEQGTPVNGRMVEPSHQAHYELVTKSGREIWAKVDFDVRNAAGQTVGKVDTTTYVDGTGYLWNYGNATNACATQGPFTCVANGTDTVTVRDRDYFEIANRTSKLTFVIDQMHTTTGFESGGTAVGTRLLGGEVLRNALNPTAGRVTGAEFLWLALDSVGNRAGYIRVGVNVEPDGRTTSYCGGRDGNFKCWDDGKGHVYFLDLSVRTPLQETH